MPAHSDAIEALATYDVRIKPSDRVCKEALVADYDAWFREWQSDPDAFWARAADELHWYEPWSEVSRIALPSHDWFVGGETNLSFNCLERNIHRGLGEAVCFHYESERDVSRTFTYDETLSEVGKVANALKSLGVGRGDRVVIYMPLCPEGLFAMHACVRIGAIHSVVYAGMGADALRHRIEDSGARAVICADATYRRGKTVDLKSIVDKAVAGLEAVEHVVVLCREPETELGSQHEVSFTDLVGAQEARCDAVPMRSSDAAFILYTSGTTGKPKGVVHVHGGFSVSVHLLMRYFFDTREDDVWWSTSDIGWIVGHAYICYGPMLAGARQVIREGAPDYPHPGVTWEIVEKHRVTTMFTAPTAVRMFMRFGDQALAKYDRSSLRILYCAGEPFNPEAWVWAQEHICVDGAKVADNYWQTEIASPMIGTFPSIDARPGYVGRPMPGVRLKIVDDTGAKLDPGEGGLLVMEQPVPWMMRTLWGDDERYASYWSERLGGYVTGDIAVCDAEGYWAVLGRADDVLNVAGHRIGTADVESALISHPAVVESAVIGLPDEIKGERIKAYVVLRSGYEPNENLRAALSKHVSESLGPIAKPSAVDFVASLPKTRSGKIMRRLLKARELGQDEGDISTLEE